MLGWLKQKITNASAQSAVKNEMGEAMKLIKKHGGPDPVVFAYVKYFQDTPEKMARFRSGWLKPEEYPMSRMLVSTAAIQSIMRARRDLRDDPNAEDARNRLAVAEHAFLLSWLHLTEADIEHITDDEIQEAIKRSFDVLMETQDVHKAYAVMPHRAVADAKIEQGQQALEKWRRADIDKFPFDAFA